MRRFTALALALACASASLSTPAIAVRPYTVEDLLSLEGLGRVRFDPTGRWLIVERFAPYSQAPTFEHGWLTRQTIGRLDLFDLRTNAPGRPLVKPQAGAGLTLGEFSPSGSRVLVFRLRDHRRELGVVTLATGAVTWSGFHVEPEQASASARWRNDHEVAVISRPPEAPSRALGVGWQSTAFLEAAWRKTARGDLAVTVLGGGRFARQAPAPPRAALALFDASRKASRMVARGAFADLLVAPDGRTAALIEETDLVPAPSEPTSTNTTERRRRLVMVDLDSGLRTEPCQTCDLLPFTWAWAPDGKALLAPARPAPATGLRFGYWRFDIEGGAERLAPNLEAGVSSGRDPRPIADVAWLGATPIALAATAGEARVDWWRLSQEPENLTAKIKGTVGSRLADGAQGVLIRAAAGIWRLGAAGSAQAVLTGAAPLAPPTAPGLSPPAILVRQGAGSDILSPNGAAPGPAIADDAQLLALDGQGGRAVMLRRDPNGVAHLTLVDRQGASRVLITQNSGLAEVTVAQALPVRHAGPQGEMLTSWLYLPASHGAGDNRAMIVSPYPGHNYSAPPSAGAPGETHFETNIQLMVAAGYAVLVPSLPTVPGREPMSGMADDILRVVEAAQAHHPGISTERLALWGQSYGGYGVLAAATQSDRFKAVIATAPVTDLFSFYGALFPFAWTKPEVGLTVIGQTGWAESGQGSMGAPPWSDPERYLRNSPGLQSDRIRAPVLLVSGDQDFDIGMSRRLYAALRRQNKDVEFLTYWGEDHVITSPANVRDLYARAFSFLSESLGAPSGAAPPGARMTPSQ